MEEEDQEIELQKTNGNDDNDENDENEEQEEELSEVEKEAHRKLKGKQKEQKDTFFEMDVNVLENFVFETKAFVDEHFKEDIFSMIREENVVYFGSQENLVLYNQVMEWKIQNPQSTQLNALQHFIPLLQSFFFFLRFLSKIFSRNSIH